MSTIDNLNFKLILDDKEFNAKVKAAEETAQKLNVSLSQLLSIQSSIGKGATKGAQQAADAAEAEARAKQKTAEYAKRLAKTTEEMAKRAENKTASMQLRDQERYNQLVERGNRSLNERGRIMRELGTVAANVFSIYAAKEVVTNLVRVSAEFEAQRTALGAILGDVAQAQNLFSDIKELAVVSPFSVRDLTAYTKQLSAFSVPYEELFETTKMLADVSAGLGVDMGRIILAYGQVRSAAFLRGTEVRQFTEAGIPILDRLADMFTEIEGRAVSVGEVFDKISFRQVPFEMVQQAFEDMTSEGGQFYNMQLVLSETLQGQLSNLKDAYQIMFAEIGEKTDGVLKGAVGLARSLAENYEKVGKIILWLAGTYGTYRAVLAVVNVLERAHIQMKLAENLGKTLSSWKAITATLGLYAQGLKKSAAAQKMLNIVTKANPYMAIVAALSLVISQVVKYREEMNAMSDSVAESVDNLNESLTTETTKLDVLFTRLQLAKEGTKEYADAKSDLMAAFGNEITALDKEGVALSNNIAYRDALIRKIRQTTIEKQRAAAIESLQTAYQERQLRIQKDVDRLADRIKATPVEREIMKEYAAGLTDIFGDDELWDKLTDRLNSFNYNTGLSKLNEYRDEYNKATIEFAQNTEELERHFEELGRTFGDTAGETMTSLMKLVHPILKDEDAYRSIWPTETTDYWDYIDTLKKRYSEINDQIRLSGKLHSDQLPALEKEKCLIEQIAHALDVALNTNIYDEITGVKASGRSGLSDADTARRDELRKQIEDLLTLKDAYDELTEAMIAAGKTPVPEDILAMLKATYGGSMNASAFADTEFLKRALELIELLRAIDPDAADAFLQRLGEDDWSKLVKHFEDLASAIEKAKKAQEDFEKYMKSWTSEAQLSGEGPSFEISKVISDYTKALEQAQAKMDEAYDKLAERSLANSAAGKGMPIWSFLLDRQQIQDNHDNDVANALAKATESIRKEAEDYVEAWEPLQKFDLSNWKDLTIRELNEIIAAVRNFDISQLPQDIAEKLSAIPGGLETFVKWFQSGLDEIEDKAENTKIEKLYESYSKIASGVSELAGSVQEFAEASGNDGLASLMEGLQGTLSITDDVLSRLAQGDKIGAIVAGVAGVAQAFFDAATQAAKLEAAIADAAEQARILRMQTRLDMGVDTIFGEDELLRLRNARDVINQLRNSLMNERSAANKQIEWKSGLFGWGRSSKSLREMMNELGYDLYDEYGNLNADGLQTILDTYEDLTSADREWIESAISNSQMYEDAILQIRDTLSGMFGSLASDLTSGMIDAYKETGDVVNGIDDAFKNLGENIVSYLLQSMIIDNVLRKYQEDAERIAAAYGSDTISESEMMEQVGTLMAGIRADVEGFRDVANAMLENADYLEMLATEGGDSLAGSIMDANLTEETGSLIASYINAIRADVSFSKSQRAQLVDMAGQILNSMMPTPKLDEYLQAIQANTLNAANAARDILSELRGVITSEGGASAVRTYM